MGFSGQLMAAVVYIDDNRRVELDGDDGSDYYSNAATPISPFADFNTAAQNSSLSTSGFTANGWGEAYSDYTWYTTWSYFDVSFSLTVESDIALRGTLIGEDWYAGSGDASIFLYSGTDLRPGNILYSDSVSASYSPSYEKATLAFNGVLAAGDYRIQVTADPYFQSAYSSYCVEADFSPVPVPATAWLFGSGILALVAAAQRKTTA